MPSCSLAVRIPKQRTPTSPIEHVVPTNEGSVSLRSAALSCSRAKLSVVELDEILRAFDRTAANLERLEAVWTRARALLPEGPELGGNTEYEDLVQSFNDLAVAVPAIDGHHLTAALPDYEAIGQGFLDCAEIGEFPRMVWQDIEEPDRAIADYRFRFNRARRRAVRSRLSELTDQVAADLETVGAFIDASDPPGDDVVDHEAADRVAQAIDEIERLIGDTAERTGRWGDLHRHLRFGQPHDWRDIAVLDWPSVLDDIHAAGFADTEPLPMPVEIKDLGKAASGELSGAATTALQWNEIDDDGFERLLFDLLSSFEEHYNVKWLMKTRAPDRGRDLSLERVLRTPTGESRMERVLVQAKHWLSKSVGDSDVSALIVKAETWAPPFHAVIMVTSGRFTTDAVTWSEIRASSGRRPDVELWSDADLERLLSRFPSIAAAHGLR